MIEMTEKPIDIGSVIQSVHCEGAGGIVHFIGTIRKEDGISGLFYESYSEMAIRMLQKIVGEAREKWELERVSVVHRTGWVAIGEPSVVIAVSAAHRREAFNACRFLIDQIKEKVPIWKSDREREPCQR